MADPVTLAAITAVSSLATGALGYTQYQYQARVAGMNAQIARDNAARSIERSQIEAQDSDFETARLLGEQVAIQGASGISLTSKSFARTRETTRLLGRRDALNIIQAGRIEAYNYQTDRANFKAQQEGSTLASYGSLLEGAVGAVTAIPARKPTLVGGSRSVKSLTRYAVEGPRRLY